MSFIAMVKLCDKVLHDFMMTNSKATLQIPEYIEANLKHNLFRWQEEAFKYFLAKEVVRKEANDNAPNHLMFNMATGSGKTLVMAALILYYYEQGYRHFLFFVNRNNIVDKTENNFINSSHSKYLFQSKIIIDDKVIPIKKVNNFTDNPQGIEIKFTSIQKLYNNIHTQRENQTTLADLHKKDIIMLADEAHHLNTTTTQQELSINGELSDSSSAEKVERLGWEYTVIQHILNKNGNLNNNRNVLLEFTATIPEKPAVIKKYENKVIYEFTLKQFLQEGFTKEISLLSSTLDKKERILQTLLFHWYRHAIAMDNDIPNFKPVILFRSKTINESKADHEFFLDMIENLKTSDFKFMNSIYDKIPKKTHDMYEDSESKIKQMMQYIKAKKIKYNVITDFLKRNFQDRNVIITNSKNGTKTLEKTTTEQEALLNNLEDKNNYIRAIFTVERLTEGWDVLNLYDIVRLYEGKNSDGKTNKTPPATIKEKQLIGRGIRYYPFSYKDKIKNKRKFDDDAKHEMRILEELFYHTYDEMSRYISELKKELRKDGYIRDDKKLLSFAPKKEFAESDFYKKTLLWKNELEDNPSYRKKTLQEIKDNFVFRDNSPAIEITEERVIIEKETDLEVAKVRENDRNPKTILFSSFENHVFRKAINKLATQDSSIFRFEKLKNLLPIKSIDDLQNDDLIGDVKLHLLLPANTEFSDLQNTRKIEIVMRFLERIFDEIQDVSAPKRGSKKFIPTTFEKEFGTSKEKLVPFDKIRDDIAKEDWHVLNNFAGTDEEVDFIEFFKIHFDRLDTKYNEIYLLRNEEVYKIYDFEKGRGFQPDFLLFLVSKGKKPLSYQIFIEPKGNRVKDKNGNFTLGSEGWKEDFLLKLTKLYGLENVIQQEFPKYRLIGFPFYNAQNIAVNADKDPFSEQFELLLQ